jgi:hypothetical protein
MKLIESLSIWEHRRFPYVPAAVLVGVALYGASLAKANDAAYVAVPDNNSHTSVLGKVDLTTGSFTQITSGQPLPYIYGLGELSGILFGTGDGLLYRIDEKKGTATSVGATGISSTGWFGSTETGLFALAQVGAQAFLYSINPGTGKATVIGPSGVSIAYSDSGATTGGLSVGAQGLYMTISTGDTLTSSFYSLNTTSGAAKLIGKSSTGTCLKGMAEVHGKLYAGSGYCTSGSDIYTVNPTTGLATFVTGANGYSDLNGLAPVVDCVLADTPTYNTATGTLTMKFQVAASTNMVWSGWLIDKGTMQTLWSTSQTVTEPAVTVVKTHAVPSKLGKVGVLSTLSTAEQGIACSSWATVDTGNP